MNREADEKTLHLRHERLQQAFGSTYPPERTQQGHLSVLLGSCFARPRSLRIGTSCGQDSIPEFFSLPLCTTACKHQAQMPMQPWFASKPSRNMEHGSLHEAVLKSLVPILRTHTFSPNTATRKRKTLTPEIRNHRLPGFCHSENGGKDCTTRAEIRVASKKPRCSLAGPGCLMAQKVLEASTCAGIALECVAPQGKTHAYSRLQGLSQNSGPLWFSYSYVRYTNIHT